MTNCVFFCFCFFFKVYFWAFCAFIDRRETVDRLVKGGERAGEDTLQTGHRQDSNLDWQKHVHGVLTTPPNQHPLFCLFAKIAVDWMDIPKADSQRRSLEIPVSATVWLVNNNVFFSGFQHDNN